MSLSFSSASWHRSRWDLTGNEFWLKVSVRGPRRGVRRMSDVSAEAWKAWGAQVLKERRPRPPNRTGSDVKLGVIGTD